MLPGERSASDHPMSRIKICGYERRGKEIFGIGKHSIHITDTKDEVEEICEMLLNTNSIHWLNTSILKEFPWFSRLFRHYKKWLNDALRSAFC